MPLPPRLASPLLALLAAVAVAACPAAPTGPGAGESTVTVKPAKKGTPAPTKSGGAASTPSPKATGGASATPTPTPKGTAGASPAATPTASPAATPAASPTPTATPAGGGASPTPGAEVPTAVTVVISAMEFRPGRVEVKKGGTVTFVNRDAASHSVAPGAGASFTTTAVMGPPAGGAVDGGSANLTFDAAGEVKYVCGIHATMKGTIVVLP